MDQSSIMGILNSVEQLLVDSGDLAQIRQAVAQMAGQRPAIDEWHDEEEDSLRFSKLDQGQNVGVVKTRYSTRLTSEAASHLRISGIIPKDHLDCHAPIKNRGACILARTERPKGYFGRQSEARRGHPVRQLKRATLDGRRL